MAKPPLRKRHTQGVVATAAKLARRHGLSARRAKLAAQFHDCAKALPRAAMKALLKRARADAEERRNPALWHAPVGAYLARREHGVRDAEVLKAIRMHTTGAPRMTPLQKVLFVADYIEPNRPPWPELKALRPLAKKNLDLAFLEVLRHKLADLLEHRRPLHSRSLAAYHHALKFLVP